MRVIDCEQNSEAWHMARLGIPTASQFKTVLAEGRKRGEPSKTRDTYMRKLIGERLSNRPMESFTNEAMLRGHELEQEAASYYSIVRRGQLETVGFCVDDYLEAGASPDRLVGNDGLLEIKTAAAHVLVEYIEADQFPPEHVWQCHGQMLITGRKWCDLLIYSPGMPTFIKRLERNDMADKTLTEGILAFNRELLTRLIGVKRKCTG